MRIAVSNLLWTRDLDEEVAGLLNRRGIDAIDIAPTRCFEDVARVSTATLRATRKFWQQRGVSITGMQSLLYGCDGLDIFGDRVMQRRTREHLCRMLRIGAELGATQLVFGSARNRDRGSLSPEDAMGRAAEFFATIAAEAGRLGVCLTIEPISACYGNNFLVDHDEAAQLVRRIDDAAFRLTLDMGCIGLAKEDLASVVQQHGVLISHVHLAEYRLAPLDAGNPLHARATPILSKRLPGRVACIEALKPPDVSSLDAIAQSLDVAQRHYG